MSLACWQRKRDPSTLMLLFVVQKLGFLGGEARKLTFGQRIVNHLLGLSPPTYRYSVPVEFLLGSAKRDLLQPSRAHMKAGRSCSWGHVCSSYSVSNWIMGFGSLEKKKKIQSAAYSHKLILLHAVVQIWRCEIHFACCSECTDVQFLMRALRKCLFSTGDRWSPAPGSFQYPNWRTAGKEIYEAFTWY